MKQDRRVQKTRNALRKAYIRLMKKYRAEEITVSMITMEADINRATFYTHFSNKEDFLEEMLFELLEGLENGLVSAFRTNDKININTLTPTTELIFQYIEDHKEAFYALSKGYKDFNKRLENLFHHLFTEKIFIETDCPLGEINYDMFIHYQTKATLGLVRYWINSDFSYSKEYMMNQLTLFSNTQIKYLRYIGE